MNLLQMSFSGAVLILLIALIRLALLRAVPKRTFLFLWALVLARLLIPFPPLLRLPAPLPEGLLTAATATAAPAEQEAPPAEPVTVRPSQPLPTETASPGGSASAIPQTTRAPAVTAAPVVSAAPAVTPAPQGPVAGKPGAALPGAALSPQMAAAGRTALSVWLIGLCVTAAVFSLLYALSYRRFRRATSLATPAAEAWLSAHPLRRGLRLRSLPGLASPLTYGVLKPVILIPAGLDPASPEGIFALEHEYVHARRLDALWKLLLMAAAAVHWFNPFVWLMWFLANRDLELSCDEAVLRIFGTERRGSYARALLSMEEKRNLLPPLHAGFGAGTTKERILAIMKYKKHTVLSIGLAALLVIALGACALGGRSGGKETEPHPERCAPGPDLTVGPVRWGMSLEDALLALAAAEGDGSVVGHEGKITLAAEFCDCPAEISWCFTDDGNGLFLNGIEVLFTDKEAFDRETVAKALEECWGQRIKYARANKYSPGVDGPDIAPKEDWYWRTADFSDEYCWKSGVTARFTAAEAEHSYLNRPGADLTGAPLLRIDATGRNQAEGRLTSLPETEESKWEVERLMGLACLYRPSAASWQYFDPATMRSDGGDDTASVRVYTPEDKALADKLFAPYSPWLRVDLPGDQYREADISGILLDGSLAPTVSVISREAVYDGWEVVFTNRTDKDLTLFLPLAILAERDGKWVQPERDHWAEPDWDTPTLAPGESYTLSCAYATRHACYDFVPGRYMLTIWTLGDGSGDLSEGGVGYGALIEITDGAPPEAGEAYVSFTSGGLLLSVPAEYADALTVETGTEDPGLLFSVTETASYEAGQKLHPGEDWGDGFLFGIRRVSEDELGQMLQWDMSGAQVFAREATGDYLLLITPTDVRFVPDDGVRIDSADPRWQQWEALNDWTWGPMKERFLKENGSLSPYTRVDAEVSSILARVLYYDPAVYGEAATALLRLEDGEGVDPLATDAAKADARRLLLGYDRAEQAAGAADFPQIGLTVTVTDPLGCGLVFRNGSDVVGVTDGETISRYLRMAPLTPGEESIGTAACRWYFHAALSGETVDYRNGSYVLSVPVEYAELLIVETPEAGGSLFSVTEKASREAGQEQHPGEDWGDGWLFGIGRVSRDEYGEMLQWDMSGAEAFAADGGGKNYYLFYHPTDVRQVPAENASREENLRRWQQWEALGLWASSAQERFISDNGLTPCSGGITEVKSFLARAVYGEDPVSIRQGVGKPCDPRVNTLSCDLLYSLLWNTEFTPVEAQALPEGEPVTLEIDLDGLGSLLFWPGSDRAVLTWGNRHFLASAGENCVGDLALGILQSAMISYPRTTIDIEYGSLDMLAESCTDILVATYTGSRWDGDMREDDFTVRRALKGTSAGPITVYTQLAWVEATEGSGAYVAGWLSYEPGEDYLLLLERSRSVFYENDHYVLPAEVFLPLTGSGTASAYGEALEKHSGLSSDSTPEEILAWFLRVIEESKAESPEYYGTDYIAAATEEEAREAAPFILRIRPTKLIATGRDGRETFQCELLETVKGDLGSLNGQIIVVFFPGVAEVGESYEVCVDRVGPDSLMFVPISREYSVHP